MEPTTTTDAKLANAIDAVRNGHPDAELFYRDDEVTEYLIPLGSECYMVLEWHETGCYTAQHVDYDTLSHGW